MKKREKEEKGTRAAGAWQSEALHSAPLPIEKKTERIRTALDLSRRSHRSPWRRVAAATGAAWPPRPASAPSILLGRAGSFERCISFLASAVRGRAGAGSSVEAVAELQQERKPCSCATSPPARGHRRWPYSVRSQTSLSNRVGRVSQTVGLNRLRPRPSYAVAGPNSRGAPRQAYALVGGPLSVPPRVHRRLLGAAGEDVTVRARVLLQTSVPPVAH